ncbi:MAG: hypothetical protein PHQ27_08720, partial [Victivallales bacterium]|nr:hypothetical protein [Victivallales bacterium]
MKYLPAIMASGILISTVMAPAADGSSAEVKIAAVNADIKKTAEKLENNVAQLGKDIKNASDRTEAGIAAGNAKIKTTFKKNTAKDNPEAAGKKSP